MRDLVSAVAVGSVGTKIVVDLDKYEEDHEEGSTDIPVAMIPGTNKVVLLQLDGAVKKEALKEALKMAKKTCSDVYKIQKKALKTAYPGALL